MSEFENSVTVQDHPDFRLPKNKNKKIWRYMDLSKLTYLLKEKALYFSNISELGDDFEGSITNADFKLRGNAENDGSEFLRHEANEHIDLQRGFSLKESQMELKLRRILIKANCWHLNEKESDLMWTKYAGKKKGVGILSNLERLIGSIKGYKNPEYIFDKDIYIGSVKYIDYTKDEITGNDELAEFFHKNNSFESEQEIRAVISLVSCWEHESSGSDGLNALRDNMRIFLSPLEISVDTQSLIEKIYIAPRTSEEEYEKVCALAEKYNSNLSVVRSALDGKPIY